MAEHGAEPRLPGLDRYTAEQLFFMGYANVECGRMTAGRLRRRIADGAVHCPGRYRVLGPLANSKEFARHFDCPDDAPMNPSTKCVLW